MRATSGASGGVNTGTEESAIRAAQESQLTPRQRERRQRILSAARQLTAERGYDGVSMREIATAAQVAEKTLYNIYVTKDRLIALAAQDRTERVFAGAFEEARGAGLKFLLHLPAKMAEVTLQSPAMARALSQVLLEHSELVGLDSVYLTYVGAALEDMCKEGLLDSRLPLTIHVRLIRLYFVATVVLWAREEIGDSELADHLSLRLCEALLPIAREPLARRLQKEARTRLRRLSAT